MAVNYYKEAMTIILNNDSENFYQKIINDILVNDPKSFVKAFNRVDTKDPVIEKFKKDLYNKHCLYIADSAVKEILDYRKENKKIYAIKTLRGYTNLSLRDSKELIDTLFEV